MLKLHESVPIIPQNPPKLKDSVVYSVTEHLFCFFENSFMWANARQGGEREAMVETDPLERLIRQETFAELVAAMTGEEILIAALRLEGLNDTQIGWLLSVDRKDIAQCMGAAQERIAEQVPDARDWVLGRQVPRGPRPSRVRPLQRGWVCRWFWG